MKTHKAASLFKNPQNWIYMIAFGVALGFASGAFAQSGNVYSDRGSQQASEVTRAVILQTRDVLVEPQNSTRYAGGAAGAALGGGVGALLGRKDSKASTVLGLVGATLGGVVGNHVAQSWGATKSVEYIVKTEGDQRTPSRSLAITQPEPGPSLAAGDYVYLIQTGGTWRVVKAQLPPSVPAASSPATPHEGVDQTAPQGTSFMRDVRFTGSDRL